MDNNSRKTTYAAVLIGLLCTSSNLHANESSAVSKTIAGTTKEYLSDPARTGSLVGSIIAGSAVANPLAPVLGSVVGFVIGKSSAFSKKSGLSASQNAYSNRSLMPADGTDITSLSLESGTSTLTIEPGNSASTLAGGNTGTPTISTGLDGNSGTGNEDTNLPGLAAAQPLLASETSSGIMIVEEIDQSLIPTAVTTIVPTEIVRGAEMGINSIHTPTSRLPMETAGDSDLQKRLADACSNYKTVKTASLNCYYYAQ